MAKNKAKTKTPAKGKGKTTAKKKEAPKKPTAIAKKKTGGALVKMSDLKRFSGQGLELARGDTDCFALAFLKILQDVSPEIKKGERKIADAEVGDLMNTVTKELFDGAEGIFLIPCFFRRAFVEWVPLNDGGGFIGEHLPTSDIIKTAQRNENNQLKLPNGHDLVDTRYHICLLAKNDNGSWSFSAIIVPMPSTQIKSSRNWITLQNDLLIDDDEGGKFNPPTFATIYQLTTGYQENKTGQSWYGWDNIKYIGLVEDQLMLNAAKSLYDLASAGAIQAQTDGLIASDSGAVIDVEGEDVPM